jgi:hypothetical protein
MASGLNSEPQTAGQRGTRQRHAPTARGYRDAFLRDSVDKVPLRSPSAPRETTAGILSLVLASSQNSQQRHYISH